MGKKFLLMYISREKKLKERTKTRKANIRMGSKLKMKQFF